MMPAGSTFHGNLGHYLDKNGELIEEPVEATIIAYFLANVVVAASHLPAQSPRPTLVRCIARRGNGRCRGRVTAKNMSKPATIHWSCERCKTHGTITGWQKTQFDLPSDSSRAPRNLSINRPVRIDTIDHLVAERLPHAVRAALLSSTQDDTNRAFFDFRSFAELDQFIIELRRASNSMSTVGAREARRLSNDLALDRPELDVDLALNRPEHDVVQRLNQLNLFQEPHEIADSVTDTTPRIVARSLFFHPPSGLAELTHRLRAHDPAALRDELLSILENDEFSPIFDSLLKEALSVVGVHHATARLERIGRDVTKSARVRAAAISILQPINPQIALRIIDSMSEIDRTRSLAEHFREILMVSEDDPESRTHLAQLLEDWFKQGNGELLKVVDQVRRDEDIPAALAYADLLKTRTIPLLRLAVEAMVSEGPGSKAFVESYAKRAKNSILRSMIKRALESVEPLPLEPPSGETWISSIDGSGAIALLMRQPRRSGGERILSVIFRVGGEIRDGFFLPKTADQDWENLRDRYESGDGPALTEVPVEVGIRCFQDALALTRRNRLPIAEDALPIAYRLDRVSCPPLVDLPKPAAKVTLGQIRSLFDRDQDYDSWFFNEGDLADANLSWSAVEQMKPAEVYAAIERSPLRDRLIAMTEHMARLYTWRSDSKRAALLATIAASLRDDFTKSRLLPAILERSPLPADDYIEATAPFGNSETRDIIRQEFFSRVTEPTGRDLERLDLIEAAAWGIGMFASVIPASERPNETTLLKIADLAASAFQERNGSIHEAELTKIIGNVTALSSESISGLASVIANGLTEFRETVCPTCPVQCFNDPDRGMTQEYLSRTHPALTADNELPGHDWSEPGPMISLTPTDFGSFDDSPELRSQPLPSRPSQPNHDRKKSRKKASKDRRRNRRR